ncbi:MAG: ATP-binding protein [Actinomycetota bacterium]
MPIRAKLTLLYVGVLAVILAAVCTFLLVRLRADLVQGVDQSLDTRVAQIALGLGHTCEGEFQDVSDSSLKGLPQGESGAQLLATGGTVLESSGDAVADRPLVKGDALADAVAGEHVRRTTAVGDDREPFRILAVALPPGGCEGVVVVGTSLDEVERSVHRLLVLMLIGGPAALIAAAAAGWWLAARSLAPVARLTRQAADIDANRLDERVQVPAAADELRRLAVTLNTLLDRVQAGVQQKRRFMADASHELRTPLGVMQAELDVHLLDPDLDPGARETLDSTREEVRRMGATVENLLELARIDEGGVALEIADVDLRELARAGAERVAPLAAAKELTVRATGGSAPARGDGERLALVMGNLLGNAIKYAPAGTTIEVSTRLDGADAIVAVRDLGPGIPASMLATIFDRFVRADAARVSDAGGSGLGLAIAREIVQAHRGRIWVESTEGAGATFTVAIPRV